MSSEPAYPSSFWAYVNGMWYVFLACLKNRGETIIVNLDTGQIYSASERD